MSLQEYGRTPSKRKEYVHHPALLLVGVDVSKAKHHACRGTQTTMRCRKLALTHPRDGFRRFAQTLKAHLVTNGRQRILSAMAPSGLSWQALYERLHSGGYEVGLGHGQAVRNHRKTRPEGTSTTDAKEAARVCDVRRQGPCLLPVARAPALQAAYRLRPRHMARKKRGSPRRHPWRAAMHLAFPELHPLLQALTPPTSVRLLQGNPTPEASVRQGRGHCLAPWQPRRGWGPWHPETGQPLSALAPESSGLTAPYQSAACESQALAHDLADALAKQPLWLDHALAFRAPRPAGQLRLQLPRIGAPPAAAILTASGALRASANGQQLVKRAGLAGRLVESGSSRRRLSQIAPVGSASLRDWLSHEALRLIAPAPHGKAS